MDQDFYVGFVGVQDEKTKNRSGSASPRSRSPSPRRDAILRKCVTASPRMPVPDIPPPAPNMKIKARTSSLRNSDPTVQSVFSSISVPGTRPAKPNVVPPPFIPEGYARKTSTNAFHQKLEKFDSGSRGRPVSPSPIKVRNQSLFVCMHSAPPMSACLRPSQSDTMTVKVHYSTTRAIRMSSRVSYGDLQEIICKKFDLPPNSLTLWCKMKNGELDEVVDDVVLKRVITQLDDGFRLTLWAYDKQEVSWWHRG